MKTEEKLNTVPVRLPGKNRRAYLLLPESFMKRDRDWIKTAVDLYLADDEGYKRTRKPKEKK